MATFVIPNEPIAHHEMQVTLDDVLYRMVFLFNPRDSFWYMNLFSGEENTLLRAGIKLVSSWDLLRMYQAEARPAGNLVMVPQGEDGAEAATLESLGVDVLLTYTGTS